MDARPPLPPLYLVHLRGAPEIFLARRAELEQLVQDHLDATYGSHSAAAGALHAYVDSLELEPDEISWEEALRTAAGQVLLPPGARFDCELTAKAMQSRVP